MRTWPCLASLLSCFMISRSPEQKALTVHLKHVSCPVTGRSPRRPSDWSLRLGKERRSGNKKRGTRRGRFSPPNLFPRRPFSAFHQPRLMEGIREGSEASLFSTRYSESLYGHIKGRLLPRTPRRRSLNSHSDDFSYLSAPNIGVKHVHDWFQSGFHSGARLPGVNQTAGPAGRNGLQITRTEGRKKKKTSVTTSSPVALIYRG